MRRWVPVAAGVVLMVGLALSFGTGPFIDGLLAARPGAVVVALVVTAATTFCCAQRWRRVAAWFGESIPFSTAYPAYYRSQLINVAVPGGVVGDVHRGCRFGWRPVVGERVIGQVVQGLLAATLVLPGAWRMPVLALLLVAAGTAGAVVILSALNAAGHLTVFLTAAIVAGADLPVSTLVTIGALVLVGSSVPLSAAGWGPREGVAAWAFSAYGSSAALGLSVSVAFGVLSATATLPGLWGLWALRGSRA